MEIKDLFCDLIKYLTSTYLQLKKKKINQQFGIYFNQSSKLPAPIKSRIFVTQLDSNVFKICNHSLN